VRRRGRQQLRQRDGVAVGARALVAHVEHERNGTFARRVCQEAKRRAVLRFERRERAGDRTQRAEHDRQACGTRAPRAEQLVAERGIPVAPRRDPRRRRTARGESALDRLVDRLGKPPAPRRADALELGHDHSAALELHARSVARVLRGEHHAPGRATRARSKRARCARHLGPAHRTNDPLGQRLVLHRDGKMYARVAAYGPLSCE